MTADDGTHAPTHHISPAPLQTQQMGKLSTREFEGVLHPIFQEDELTLIIAGGFLGLLAGAYQVCSNDVNFEIGGVVNYPRSVARAAAFRHPSSVFLT